MIQEQKHIIYSSTVFTISDSAEILKAVNPLACPTHNQYAFVENMFLFLPKNFIGMWDPLLPLFSVSANLTSGSSHSEYWCIKTEGFGLNFFIGNLLSEY